MTVEFVEPDASFDKPAYRELLERLSQSTAQLEAQPDQWPLEQLNWLASAGVLGWVIPIQYGGSELNSAELNLGYEQLAASCLVTTFILTQRNGACQRIAGCDNEGLKARLLADLCSGKLFATVGISHLTTSRQHLNKPAVTAEKTEQGYLLNGTIPWVTGAVAADYIVTGATCDDGRQILTALNTSIPGVSCDSPEQLLSLTASQTGLVQLNQVGNS
ncbi:MAG: acyl-CoA dehydrogenase family protein [Planctomycetaceae bacterium]